MRNHYATKFTDAMDVARQAIPRLPELRVKTIAFVRGVAEHSLRGPIPGCHDAIQVFADNRVFG